MTATSDALNGLTAQVTAFLADSRKSNARVLSAQDSGSADTYVFSPLPAVTSYGPDMFMVVDVANPNKTTNPSVNVSGLGAIPLTASDGTAVAIGAFAGKCVLGFATVPGGGYAARHMFALSAAALAALFTTTGNAITSLLKVRLQGNTTFYVNSVTGADAPTRGTQAAPWASVQYALDSVAANYDLNGFNVTIQLADGLYAAALARRPWVGGGGYNVTINGNSANPSAVIVQNTSPSYIGALGATSTGVGFCVQNLKMINLSTSAPNPSACLYSDQNALVTVTGPVVFGAAANAHFYAVNGGVVVINSSYSITANAPYHYLVTQRGEIVFTPTTIVVNISSPLTVIAFANIVDLGLLGFNSGVSFTGSATTGQRYVVSNGSVIDTQGQGASYVPGNSAGNSTTGYYS